MLLDLQSRVLALLDLQSRVQALLDLQSRVLALLDLQSRVLAAARPTECWRWYNIDLQSVCTARPAVLVLLELV